jgi:hypothetical protein
MGHRRRSVIANAARRVAVALAFLAYLLASIGFPLPAFSGKAAPRQASTKISACGCEEETKRLRSCCCCRAERRCCSESPPEKEGPPAIQWVIGVQQQECQGLAPLWLAAGLVSLLPPALVSLGGEPAPSGWAPVMAEQWINQPEPPASPPPRAADTGMAFRSDAGASAGARPCLNRRDIGA